MGIDSRQKQYLRAMGIPLWTARRELPGARRDGGDVAEDNNVIVTQTDPASASGKDPQSWEALQQAVAHCHACDLAKTRTHTVFGVGNEAADWMIIGEAPGRDEDLKGEPFVGKAGQLLNEMLAAIGLSRQQVFIANILKCRPPNNRDPRPEEIAQCADFLLQQIGWIKPKIILSVGRISAQNLLQKKDPIGRLRGRVYKHPPTGIPIVVTYHPAYLLRSPQEKRKAWADLVLAKRTMA